jgi:hypothetical protein
MSAPNGMDGNQLGIEIAEEIKRVMWPAFPLYFFSDVWFILMWQAVGRMIVAHIQRNMVVTTPVRDYMPGDLTTPFPSNKVE